MHSPFSFFIFVMSTLFFAVLILGIFRTPLNSSRILSMSCCLFILFLFSDTFFMFLLRSFRRCCSSLGMLLLSSMSLRISASQSRQFFILFCCCKRGHLCFFVVVLEHARASAVMEHDRTCLFDLMWNLCTKMFFWIAFRMIITEWALFRQSHPCPQVAAAAAAISCMIHTSGCGR